MIASGFRPVGWVAAVGGAALGCYMLSLQVAAERADLTGLDHRIIAARQQIRSLQTELGTRGRIQQLEAWNDQVLALSAPVSGQFVEGQVSLARFDARQPQLADQAAVRLASAETPASSSVAAPSAPSAPSVVPRPQRAVAGANPLAAPAPIQQATVQRTSLAVMATPAPAAARDRSNPPAAARTNMVSTPDRGRAANIPATRTAPLADRRAPTASATQSAQVAATPDRMRLAAAGRPEAAKVAASPDAAMSRTRTRPTEPSIRTRTANAGDRPHTAATAPRGRAAASAAPRSSLLSDRAMRDLRTVSRAEHERGTGN